MRYSKIAAILLSCLAIMLLYSCAGTPRYGRVQPNPDKPEPTVKSSKPQSVHSKDRPSPKGRIYQEGTASWYGKKFHGRKTASGERFDMHQLTAAHKTLPFGTVVRVTNLENGRTVDVRINDRGPHTPKRIIDISYSAAKKLGLIEQGLGRVSIEIISK